LRSRTFRNDGTDWVPPWILLSTSKKSTSNQWVMATGQRLCEVTRSELPKPSPR
jgi:hypothetical protein